MFTFSLFIDPSLHNDQIQVKKYYTLNECVFNQYQSVICERRTTTE
jgi:hypothetical protein